jgi:coenzyme PQQ precursor peptide PqqA
MHDGLFEEASAQVKETSRSLHNREAEARTRSLPPITTHTLRLVRLRATTLNPCLLGSWLRNHYVELATCHDRKNLMTWKAPKIVEVPVGMEINMYACAGRK